MYRKSLGVLVLLLLASMAVVLASCSTGDDGSDGDSSTPTAKATGEPFKVGFNEGFTGFMATNAMLEEHGILTAMAQVDEQLLGRPLEYIKADNGSDPVQAVDKARQQVESQGVQVMIGPEYSPATAAVTDYLAKGGGIPQVSVYSQPKENLKTANGLAFMPFGIYGTEAYLFGKYCVEELGLKTVNCLSYEDTASRALQGGFKEGFTEAGGQVLSDNYVPPDVSDFSSYLGSMKKADCTSVWIYGNGIGPFVKQYNDYGIEGQLAMPTASACFTEPQMEPLGDLALDIIGLDICSPEYDNPVNKRFVEDYRKQWDNETPTGDSYGGYLATLLFMEAVKATDGDTSPAALIKALSTITVDGPTGPVSFTKYKDAYIGKVNLFFVKTQKLDDGRIGWAPVKVVEQVELTPR